MEVLPAFLTILNFLAIMLLSVFCILLFLIIIALFGGIRYYVFVEKKEDICVNVKLSFIRIVNFIFLWDKDVNKSYLQILFFKFFKRGFYEKKNLKKDIEIENFGDNGFNYNKLDFFEKEEEHLNKNNKDFFEKEKNFNKKSFSEEKSDKRKYHRKKDMNNILSSVKNIYNKFIYLKNYPERDKIIRYTINFIRDLFSSVKPKKFETNIIVGFDDPAATGKLLGFTAIILEFLHFDIYLSGDFENKIFEGVLETRGKTNIFKIAVPTLKYLLKKPIWRLIKNRKGGIYE